MPGVADGGTHDSGLSDGSARASVGRAAAIATAVVTISLGHYLTPPAAYHWHVIFQSLYYIPILLGAVWFGTKGGVVTSGVVCLAYFPHIVLQWQGMPEYRFVQSISLVLYVFFGTLAGLSIDRLQRERERHRRTAEELQRAYGQLQATFDRLRLVDRLSGLGALSAGMAHEIRNPLGAISGAIEILDSEISEGDPKREFVVMLRKEVERLSTIVTRQLDFARTTTPERSPVDLRGTLASVASLTAKAADEQGVSIAFTPPEFLPSVMVDEQQVRQAVLNLVINAIQAMPRGGHVVLSASADEESVHVVVEDDGPGFPAGDRARIFEPFFTTKKGGTGLGLSIAFQTAERHGGDLLAENRLEGGARFTLELPVGAGRTERPR